MKSTTYASSTLSCELRPARVSRDVMLAQPSTEGACNSLRASVPGAVWVTRTPPRSPSVRPPRSLCQFRRVGTTQMSPQAPVGSLSSEAKLGALSISLLGVKKSHSARGRRWRGVHRANSTARYTILVDPLAAGGLLPGHALVSETCLYQFRWPEKMICDTHCLLQVSDIDMVIKPGWPRSGRIIRRTDGEMLLQRAHSIQLQPMALCIEGRADTVLFAQRPGMNPSVIYRKYSGSYDDISMSVIKLPGGWKRTFPPAFCAACWLGPSRSFSGAAWKTLKYIDSPGPTSSMLAELPQR